MKRPANTLLIGEVSDLLKVSTQTLRNWDNHPELYPDKPRPIRRQGQAARRYLAEEIQSYLKTTGEKPAATTGYTTDLPQDALEALSDLLGALLEKTMELAELVESLQTEKPTQAASEGPPVQLEDQAMPQLTRGFANLSPEELNKRLNKEEND